MSAAPDQLTVINYSIRLNKMRARVVEMEVMGIGWWPQNVDTRTPRKPRT